MVAAGRHRLLQLPRGADKQFDTDRYGMARTVDDSDTVGRTKGNERGFTVLGHADADRLDRLAP